MDPGIYKRKIGAQVAEFGKLNVTKRNRTLLAVFTSRRVTDTLDIREPRNTYFLSMAARPGGARPTRRGSKQPPRRIEFRKSATARVKKDVFLGTSKKHQKNKDTLYSSSILDSALSERKHGGQGAGESSRTGVGAASSPASSAWASLAAHRAAGKERASVGRGAGGGLLRDSSRE